MAWRWPGDKPLSEPMMAYLLMHICFTQFQWVNHVNWGTYHTLSGILNTLWPCDAILYVNTNLSQHWLRQWLVAWGYKATSLTNVDLPSVETTDIHLRSISPQPSIPESSLKITYLKFHSWNLPRTNELITGSHCAISAYGNREIGTDCHFENEIIIGVLCACCLED